MGQRWRHRPAQHDVSCPPCSCSAAPGSDISVVTMTIRLLGEVDGTVGASCLKPQFPCALETNDRFDEAELQEEKHESKHH